MKNFLRKNEELIMIPGEQGDIEAILSRQSSSVIIICHPDPLQKGTMFNKVISTIARSFEKKGLSTLRFNYRGVGNSHGSYGHVKGEINDALSVHDYLKSNGWDQFHLAGFSFGSFIATSVCTSIQAKSLTLVAPPVKRFDYQPIWPDIHVNVHQGLDDDVVIASDVIDFIKHQKRTYCRLYDNTGHFFHGNLINLQQEIMIHHD